MLPHKLMVGDDTPDLNVEKWMKGEPVNIKELRKVYLIKWEDGRYGKPEKLDSTINKRNTSEIDDCISPDEKFIIFEAYGRRDTKGDQTFISVLITMAFGARQLTLENRATAMLVNFGLLSRPTANTFFYQHKGHFR